ncbi:MAG: macro domain-containing protein [Lachnospiraceae bacterium]|nr:macro domain-containing protein [Lachnospiraceae bacterium]
MPFTIIRNDITKVKADAIVNTANPNPVYASGTDAAVYQAAGAELLLAERKKIGKIERGHVVVTPAFALPAKYIIHTVGPSWTDGLHGEFEILADCYKNSLGKAAELRCESIAFPLIATGTYGFPKDKALQIAITQISAFLLAHEMQVILTVFDRQSFELSGRVFQNVDAFIDEYYVEEKKKTEYRFSNVRRTESEKSLDATLGQAGETFQQRLLHLIDERGLSDVEVYKSANLDRKLFSKIRCNENYKPRKNTALALAIALKLDLDETADLLKRAGLALSPSSISDLIIEYFISKKDYDIYEINMALFEHEQPLLVE